MADISKLVLANGDEYNFKDAQARDDIEALSRVKHWLGITTTPLTDGSSTNPIVIGGESVTAVEGNFVGVYDTDKEFVFNGTIWQELGSLSDFGDLAFKDTAETTYTPEGGINLTPTAETSVEGIDSVGTLPNLTVSGETLTFSQGTLPTKAAPVLPITALTASFLGTQATITVS